MSLRSIKRVKRHTEFLRMLVLHPNESSLSMQEMGVRSTDVLSHKQERNLLNSIKERVNGSDHS